MSEQGVLLTISVAAYNMERYIGPCLRSLMDYRFLGKIEVLVIDDGGTDLTMAIARAYDRLMPGMLRLVHKPNGGWGSTVNYSIQYARGRYYRILDGDDLFDAAALEQELRILEGTDVDLVYTPHIEFESREERISAVGTDGSGGMEGTICLPGPGTKRCRQELRAQAAGARGIRYCGWENPMPAEGRHALADVIDRLQLCMHNCTFRTELLRREKVRLPEHCFYTDNNYVFQAVQGCHSVWLLRQYVYWYRKGRNGQSTARDSLRTYEDDHTRVVTNVLNDMEQAGVIPGRAQWRQNAALARNLAGMVMCHYGLLLFLGPDRLHRRETLAFDRAMRLYHPELILLRWKCCVLVVMLRFPGYYVTSVLFHFYNCFRRRF